VSIQHLTGATDTRRPAVCRNCAWWQGNGARPVDRRRWIEDVEDDFGAWGEVYLDGDRHVASLQYGPAPAFPRARTLPAGPPSDDAVLVTCAYLSDPSSPWSLQSLFLACIGACHERDVPAIEAFAVVHPPGAEFAERFLHHRTIFPRDFLADYGFATLRSAGRVELMRLELRGLQPIPEDRRVAHVVRRAAEIIARPSGLAEPV
jgi:hypothetical protein